MIALQRLFDRLVGVAHYEAAVRQRARQLFGEPRLSLATLDKPACWRRPARIRLRR